MLEGYYLALAAYLNHGQEKRTVDDSDFIAGLTVADEIRDTWRRIRRLADGRRRADRALTCRPATLRPESR